MTSSTNGDKNRKNNGNYDVIHFEVVNTIVALIKEDNDHTPNVTPFNNYFNLFIIIII